MNIQGWFPLGLTSLISLQFKGLSRVFSYIIQKNDFFSTQPSLWSHSHMCAWLLETPQCIALHPSHSTTCLAVHTVCAVHWTQSRGGTSLEARRTRGPLGTADTFIPFWHTSCSSRHNTRKPLSPDWHSSHKFSLLAEAAAIAVDTLYSFPLWLTQRTQP